jgi:PleD family two-component response regulator
VPHILIATDADWIRDEVVAALGGPDTSFSVVRAGRDVLPVVAERTPDLAVLDLQIGNMGAMAVTMALRLEESATASPTCRCSCCWTAGPTCSSPSAAGPRVAHQAARLPAPAQGGQTSSKSSAKALEPPDEVDRDLLVAAREEGVL